MQRPKFRPKPHGGGKNGNQPVQAARQTLAQDHVVFGLHAAEGALANPSRRIKHGYLTENAASKLAALLSAREVPTTAAHPPDLDALVGSGAVHQGVVLHVEPLEQPGLDDFFAGFAEGDRATVAMLDQVTDPHNVGAVIRSAAAFGVSGLVVQDRHSPALSGTLAKAASGGLEHVPVVSTVNLARALERAKDHGFRCIGFDSAAGDPFNSQAASAERILFVFGAEDKGIRRLVREGCDALYSLQAPGPIKSINISNAAAIVFYEAAKTKS